MPIYIRGCLVVLPIQFSNDGMKYYLLKNQGAHFWCYFIVTLGTSAGPRLSHTLHERFVLTTLPQAWVSHSCQTSVICLIVPSAHPARVSNYLSCFEFNWDISRDPAL